MARDVTRGAQFSGRRITTGSPVAEKSQLCHNYFIQYSKFSSIRPRVRRWGRQTCFLPQAPSNLVTPLHVAIALSVHFKMTYVLWHRWRSRIRSAKLFTNRQSNHNASRVMSGIESLLWFAHFFNVTFVCETVTFVLCFCRILGQTRHWSFCQLGLPAGFFVARRNRCWDACARALSVWNDCVW